MKKIYDSILFLSLFTFTNIAAQTFTSTPVISVNGNQTYAYQVTATDANGDALAITATTKPSWLALEQPGVSTLAGSTSGFADGLGTAARFSSPTGVAVDGAGNVYVADQSNHNIRKITPTGEVTTLAGSSGLSYPAGVAVDGYGNVYVPDSGNHKILKITPSGEVSTLAGSGSEGFADGPGTEAQFYYPSGVAVDNAGNVYVTDNWNGRIRKITLSGEVSTLVDPSNDAFEFSFPEGVTVDGTGNVYVANTAVSNIRKITPTGDISTLAGSSGLSYPSGVAVDGYGNVYVADTGNHKIRKITPSGEVSTLAGTGDFGFANGLVEEAQFYSPSGVAVDNAGNVYVADRGNNKIRKITNQIVLTGTPGINDVGDHDVVLEVNDGNGGTVQQSFTITVIGKPSVTTSAATSITPSGATLNGDVTSDGYATIIERGFVYALTSDDNNPTVAEANGTTVIKVTQTGTTGAFSKVLTSLLGNSNYSYIAYAINSVGTTESSPVATFTTLNTVPEFTSIPIEEGVVGQEYSYEIIATDADGDALAFTATTKPSWLTIEQESVVSTLAGSTSGFADGLGTEAKFNGLGRIAVDDAGNVYVADQRNHKIRKITPTGVVSTLAGSGIEGFADGLALSAQFERPRGVAVDVAGNVYVADSGNDKIRKINQTTGEVSTLAGTGDVGSADGLALSAQFNGPTGVAVDGYGNVYVADTGNHKIRKITPTGVVSTLAVVYNGYPNGVAVDGAGNVYVAETSNHKIRKITLTGEVTTLAGSTSGFADGLGTAASFNTPSDVAVDGAGNVYVADNQNQKIRKITPTGAVSTMAGSTLGFADGPVIAAQFNFPYGVAVDGAGNVYVSDYWNYKIRKITNQIVLTGTPGINDVGDHNVILEVNDGNGGTVQQSFTITVIGKPSVTAAAATSITPSGATLNGDVTSDGNGTITERGFVFALTSDDDSPTLAEANDTTVIKVTQTGTTGTFSKALIGLQNNSNYSYIAYAINSAGTTESSPVATFTTLNTVPEFTSIPIEEGVVGQEYSYEIIATDADGDALAFTATTKPSWLTLEQEIIVSTLAGSGIEGFSDGIGTEARFNKPTSVAVDQSGNVYVADNDNHKIRKITPTGEVSTLAGTDDGFADGLRLSAQFERPRGVAVDVAGNVYVGDYQNRRIRKITKTTGEVSTLAGTGDEGSADGPGPSAQLSRPLGVAVDGAGNVYVADHDNHMIRKIDQITGEVSTLAGTGDVGSADGPGISAQFIRPRGVAVDGAGNVYVADSGNHKIRKITPTGVVSTLAGTDAGFADGSGQSAKFYYPSGVAVDGAGNVYVADSGNQKIRKITPTGEVSTLAGTDGGFADGPGAAAKFFYPEGVAVDNDGNVYVADMENSKIRKITNQIVLTGTPGINDVGDHDVILEVNDGNGGTVQQSFTISVIGKPSVTAAAATNITPSGATLNGDVTSDGNGTITERGFVFALTSDDDSPTLAEANDTTVIKVTQTGTTGTFSKVLIGLQNNSNYSYIAYAINSAGTTESSPVATFTTLNTVPEFTSTPTLTFYEGDAYAYTAMVNDIDNDLVSMSASTVPSWISAEIIPYGKVTTFAGGTLANASFNTPLDVAVDSNGYVYVADTNNHCIKKISLAGAVSIFAGSLDGSEGDVIGVGTNARFSSPTGIDVDDEDNLYVVDHDNGLIKKITPTGAVSIIAGKNGVHVSSDGSVDNASFFYPFGIAVDASKNIYTTEIGNNTIRKTDSLGNTTTIAGMSGINGDTDGYGTNASLSEPYSIEVDDSGMIYFSEYGNDVLRTIDTNNNNKVTTIRYEFLRHEGVEFISGIVANEQGNVTVATSHHLIIPLNIMLQEDPDLHVGNESYYSIDPGYIDDDNKYNVRFDIPTGMAIDASGNIFIVDTRNNAIRKMAPAQIQLIGDTTGNVGNHNVVLEANDGNGGTVEQSFTISVIGKPSVITTAATDQTQFHATLNGGVTSDGNGTITDRGFVFALTSDDDSPTVAEANGSTVIKVTLTGTTGTFSKALTDLQANSSYSYVAYATNSAGTAYGTVKTFTTLDLVIPTISFTNSADKIYGDDDFDLTTSSDSSGIISYSIVTGGTGTASLSGTNNKTVTPGDAGTVTVRATQAADGIYAAVSKEFTLTIAPAPLTITANSNQTKVYGAIDPTLTFRIAGFVDGDTESDLDTGVSISRAAGETVGTYVITPSAADANYTVSFVTADFSITRAPLTITANSGQTKVYGAIDPTLTYRIAGFVNGDTESDLDTGVSISRAAGETVGTYVITPSASADANYTVSFVTADFSITRAPLTITVISETKVYGETDPTLTYSITGLVNGEDATDLTGTLSISRAAGESVRTYAITASGFTSTNYAITYTAGTITITSKTVTDTDITVAPVADLVYNGSLQRPKPIVEDGSNILEEGSDYSLSYSDNINVGTATITITGIGNYSGTRTVTFMIVPKVIAILIPDQEKDYGAQDPILLFTADPTLFGSDVFTGSLSRVSGELVGDYLITPGTLSAGDNYTLDIQTDAIFIIIRSDSDGDGVADDIEEIDGTDPLVICDFVLTSQTFTPSTSWNTADCDTDGVTNADEVTDGTDPLNPDTDGDGVIDGDELADGTDGLDFCSSEPSSITMTLHQDYLDADCDGDGLSNGDEIGPDGNNPIDSDGDGVLDYLELNNHSDSEDDLEIFNLLTPNNDGENDVFVIRNIELYPENTLEVYNRWGVQVYNVSGYGQNGRYFAGESDGRGTVNRSSLLPTGTYFYILKYKSRSGKLKERKGYLYLTR